MRRTITRAACDPFTCYRGLGSGTENSEVPEKEMEAAMQQSDDDSKPSGVPLNALEPQDDSPWYLGEHDIHPSTLSNIYLSRSFSNSVNG